MKIKFIEQLNLATAFFVPIAAFSSVFFLVLVVIALHSL